MLFRFTLALLFAPKTRRQRLFGHHFPGTVNTYAYLPLAISVTIIVPLEVIMVGKVDDDVDAQPRVINKLQILIFMAGACGGGPCTYTCSRSWLDVLRTVALLQETSTIDAQIRATANRNEYLCFIANPLYYLISKLRNFLTTRQNIAQLQDKTIDYRKNANITNVPF
jgi:hypothetical protein